jgi:hypothetical protein
VPRAAELELPTFDDTDASLRGARYRQAMAEVRGHDGWLAASPFGFIVLDRDAGEFFLRNLVLNTLVGGVDTSQSRDAGGAGLDGRATLRA